MKPFKKMLEIKQSQSLKNIDWNKSKRKEARNCFGLDLFN